MLKKRNLNKTTLNPKPSLTELGIFINLCVNNCNFKRISKKNFSAVNLIYSCQASVLYNFIQTNLN